MPKKEGVHTDGTGVTDELVVELNGEVIEGKHTLPSLPEKPTSGSTKSAWEEFAIGNGLDRDVAESWSKEDLIKWIG